MAKKCGKDGLTWDFCVDCGRPVNVSYMKMYASRCADCAAKMRERERDRLERMSKFGTERVRRVEWGNAVYEFRGQCPIGGLAFRRNAVRV